MNAVHFHLILNHFPIVLSIIGFLVLSMGLILRNTSVKGVALSILILGGFFSFLTSRSGGEAEELVENISEFDKNVIHEHEEKAEPFTALFMGLGLVSIVGLWSIVKQKKYAKYISILVLAICIPVIVLGFLVGTSGGEIRHSEIRKDAVITTLPEQSDSPAQVEDKEDDH